MELEDEAEDFEVYRELFSLLLLQVFKDINRVAILAFLRPNSSNLAFFKGVWLAKFRLAFWLF